MFKKINLTIFLRVHDLQAAESLLAKVRKNIEVVLATVSCEPYWKDNALFRVELNYPLEIEEVSTAIFETLQVLNKLAHHWTISGPSQFEGNKWLFEGIAVEKDCKIQGITFIDFSVNSYD